MKFTTLGAVLLMTLGVAAATAADPLATDVAAIIEKQLDGDKAGGAGAFPAGARLDSVTVSASGVADIRLHLPESYLEDLRAGRVVFEHLVRAVDQQVFALPLSGFQLSAWDSETGTFQPLGHFEEDPGPLSVPVPDTASPVDEEALAAAAVTRQVGYTGGRATGSLTNRVVHLNAGHGWTSRSSGAWGLQRGYVYENIEDMSNADTVHQYVVAYLVNAGADVFTVRESDANTNMVIVDNDDGAPNYVETGTTWSNSSLAGFANGHIPYVRSDTTSATEDPFSFGTNRLTPCVVGTPTATATWIPTIPEAGFYNVYVSHGAFSNRSPQAHYRIHHAGGATDYYLDQRRYRFTWVFIGRYYFDAGRNPDSGKVVLSNASTSTAHFVSADAVRFGGGMGLVNRSNRGVSGKPRHDEESVYHLQFSGAPTTVHQRSATDDESAGWSGRPRFGDWLRTRGTEYGAPAQEQVIISNHTNATAAGTARGIISYLYTGYESTIHDRFRQAVHNQIVLNLRDGYGGDFVANSNPLRSGQYGEASPTNSGGIPIFLGEWLFHDNDRDMALYHDPQFRRLMARGMYQGIVKFFQSEYGGPGTLLPEPPRNVRATVLGPTSVRLDWTAPVAGPTGGNGDAATGYLVAQSTHGRGFPPGIAVTGTTHTVSGLQPGTTYYFQLRATNAGGQSFPAETLAVRTSASSSAPSVLVVSGFDKMDVATRIPTSYSGGTLWRQYPAQMNGHDHIVEHAKAIEAAGAEVRVSSAEHDAVEAGLVSLSGHDAVVWIGGLQAEVSTADPTDDTALKTATRTALTNYLAGGGRLMMSGAAIAQDLNRLGQTTFQRDTLRMTYASKGSGVTAVSGVNGSIFAGLPAMTFGQGREGKYFVTAPDVLTPATGAVAALSYGQASGTTTVDGFEDIGGWRQPSFSGQTNADPSSSFAIVSSPVKAGSGSGQLNYVWGTGDFIRLYNSGLPSFSAQSNFGIWVRGDGSGHEVRVCLRDSDNDLFVTDWTVLNFTDWRQIAWDDVANNPKNTWVQSGDGVVTGPDVRFDSMQVRKVATAASGSVFFDEALAVSTSTTPVTGPVAAIQYAGTSRVVTLGFPFETVEDGQVRGELMGRILDFLLPGSAPQQVRDAWMVH